MGLLDGLMTVEQELRHVLYVSYLVPVSRVRSLVPEFLPLAVIGENKVIVSAVALGSINVHLQRLPYVSFNYNQINVRTYVKDPKTGNQAVYFLISGITSRFVSLLTRLAGLNWHYIEYDFEVRSSQETGYNIYKGRGEWGGKLFLEVAEIPQHPGEMPPFKSIEAVSKYVTQAVIGFYGTPDVTKRYQIWHPRLEPKLAQLRALHFSLLHAMELVTEEEIDKPHNVLIVEESSFRIFLPAEKVSRRVESPLMRKQESNTKN